MKRDMKRMTMMAIAVICLGAGHAASAQAPADQAAPTKIFSCHIGKKTVSVTDVGGQLTYHYGKADNDEMTIVGAPKAGTVFRMSQRFAGMEYQLRFRNGAVSYIVYSSEGNGRVGAAATSGLVVMRDAKRISDKTCSPYAELALPADIDGLPEDTEVYSAM